MYSFADLESEISEFTPLKAAHINLMPSREHTERTHTRLFGEESMQKCRPNSLFNKRIYKRELI